MSEPYMMVDLGQGAFRFLLGTKVFGTDITIPPRVGVSYYRDNADGEPVFFRNGAPQKFETSDWS